tara:strand:- start:553 stop:747 length:195 start_codon:yes stop_codon:yes gene_type:complete
LLVDRYPEALCCREPPAKYLPTVSTRLNGAHRNVYGEMFNANPNATRYRQRYRSSALLRYLSAI